MASTADDLWPLADANQATGLPLQGLRVLDLSRVYAGPLAGMVLGDLGADVVKVEQPEGDPVRGFAPPLVSGVATYYLAANRNRRNICLDLKDPAHQAHLDKMVSVADVVLDNFLPSQAASLGIDELRLRYEGVVWISVGAADSTGPLHDEPSFDLLAQARSGLMGVTGTPASGPLKVGVPVADVVAGLYAAIAALTGLVQKGRMPEGAGLRAEAPLLESALSALANQAQGWLATGTVPKRLGNEHPSICPYAPYDTKDGVLLLAAATESSWHRLVDVLGHPELADDARFRSNEERVKNRDLLRTELEAALSAKSSDEWSALLALARVPSAPVYDVDQALQQEQVSSGDLLQEVELSSGELVTMMTSPLRINGQRPRIRLRPPTKGEHDGDFGVPKKES